MEKVEEDGVPEKERETAACLAFIYIYYISICIFGGLQWLSD